MPDEKPDTKVQENSDSKPDTELSEDSLDTVAGGSDINPQPLPPFRHEPM